MIVHPPRRQNTFTLSDGRLLAWSEWGSPSGIPILFCTGAGMSSSLSFGVEHLADLGVRLLTIDRPGLGGSTPHRAKTLTTWAQDVHAFQESLGFKRLGAVGFSQGAPFALALAAYDVVHAVALVSGQDELAHPAMRDMLTTHVQQMVEAVKRDPKGFAEELGLKATADNLWKLIMGMSSDRDCQLYQQEPFRTAYLTCLREGFSQGAKGYARDLVNALQPWPFDLLEVKIPVQLWYGAQDTSPVHSPDFGETLKRRLPRAKRTVLLDEGSSLLWARPRQIITTLISDLR